MGDEEEAVRRAAFLLEGTDGSPSSGWAAAREVVKAAKRDEALARQIPRELMRQLERLVDLNQKSVAHEYVQEVVTQALKLERDIFACKLRDMQEVGQRCNWGDGYGDDEAEVLGVVRQVLDEEVPEYRQGGRQPGPEA